MKNKAMIFRGKNTTEEMEFFMNKAIIKENRNGWKVSSIKTEMCAFGERMDENFGKMPVHIFYMATVLFEKKEKGD